MADPNQRTTAQGVPAENQPKPVSDKQTVAQKGAKEGDEPKDRDYHDKSVQERMNRPTPQQQRSAGREGGEDIEGQTPTDRHQDQGSHKGGGA